MRGLLILAGALATPSLAQTAPRVETTVLARSAAAGEIIDVQALTSVSLPPGEATGALDADQLIGKAARRALPAGRPIRAADVETPRLVRRGETVRLTITGLGYRINSQARALASAGAGEAVRLVLDGSNRQLDAMVSGRGEARISD